LIWATSRSEGFRRAGRCCRGVMSGAGPRTDGTRSRGTGWIKDEVASDTMRRRRRMRSVDQTADAGAARRRRSKPMPSKNISLALPREQLLCVVGEPVPESASGLRRDGPVARHYSTARSTASRVAISDSRQRLAELRGGASAMIVPGTDDSRFIFRGDRSANQIMRRRATWGSRLAERRADPRSSRKSD